MVVDFGKNVVKSGLRSYWRLSLSPNWPNFGLSFSLSLYTGVDLDTNIWGNNPNRSRLGGLGASWAPPRCIVAYFETTNRSFCTYTLMLWVGQTEFHVTFGCKAEVWSQLPPRPQRRIVSAFILSRPRPQPLKLSMSFSQNTAKMTLLTMSSRNHINTDLVWLLSRLLPPSSDCTS